MHIKTILNRLQKHKGFVYGDERLLEEDGQKILEVPIRAHRRNRALCSGCGRKAPGYDMLAARRFQFISLWGILVFFVYAMRRVECPRCGIKAERVPWAEGKSPITTTYAWFLAGWAKRFCWRICCSPI